MDFTLTSTDLSKELQFLDKVVRAKPAYPILSNVLLQATADGVTLATTDLEIGLVTSCQADVTMPGSTTVPVKALKDLVKLMPNANVRFSLDGETVKISSGGYSAKMQTLTAKDFPSLPTMKGVDRVMLPRLGLKEIVRKTLFVVPEQSDKRVPNGALLLLGAGKMVMVAVQNTRLVRAGAVCNEEIPGQQMLIPRSTLDMLSDLLDEGLEETVLYGTSGRHIFFAGDGRLLISRTLEMAFPAYERVIPKDGQQPYKIQIQVPTFDLALQRVGLMATKALGSAFTLSPGKLTISSTAQGLGSADESLPVQYDGPELTVWANGELMRDFLAVCQGRPVVSLELKDPRSVLLFSDGPAHQYIMMPMLKQ